MPKTIELRLPEPHQAQQKIIRESKRFNVVCCGRRWGKTVLGMDRLIHPALQGKPVAWFAPNYRLLSDVWRELQATLDPVIVKVNQQERRLELHGGGVIEMWSLDSPDSGRGRAYAVAVDSLMDKITQLEQEARRLGKKAEDAGDLRAAMAAVRELVRIVELLAKIKGDIKDPGGTTVNVVYVFNTAAEKFTNTLPTPRQ